MSEPVVLNWRDHSVGRPLACWRCGRPALCRDENGQPCHKVCAELAARPGPPAAPVAPRAALFPAV